MIRSLLLIEDDYLIADAAVKALGAEGIEVLPVPNVETALRSLKERDFDGVIVDVELDGPLNGVALIQSMRTMRPGMPVAITTAFDKDSIGAPDGIPVLEKPYRFQELVSALRGNSGGTVGSG